MTLRTLFGFSLIFGGVLITELMPAIPPKPADVRTLEEINK
jgi:hypothetical protein